MKTPLTKGPKQRKTFRDKYLAVMIAVMALISIQGFSQGDSAKYSQINGYGFAYKRFRIDSVFLLPLSSSPHTPYRPGGLRYRISDSSLQVYTGFQWIGITGGGGGSGSVTSFSAGNLSPLFTTSVATATTTPALTFALSSPSAYSVFMNNTGSSAPPAFSTPVLASLLFGSQGTTSTLLHGNASGAPSWAAVNLASEVTGNLSVNNLNSGTNANNLRFWRGDGTWNFPDTATYLATKNDLRDSSFIVGRNLKVIDGSPNRDTLLTKDTLISVTLPTTDSSTFVATTAYAKQLVAGLSSGGGGSAAAGSPGDIQIQGSTGLLSTPTGSFFNIDSTNKRLKIGNPGTSNDMVDIDSGDVDLKAGKYKINDISVLEQNSSANQLEVGNAAAITTLNLRANGNIRLNLTNTVATFSTTTFAINSKLTSGGVSVIDWSGVDLSMGSNDAGFNNVLFKVAGSEKMRLDNSGRLGIGLTPSHYLQIKAGTSTIAPILLTSGTNLTSATAGALEYNGTSLFFSPSTTRLRTVLTDNSIPSNGQIPIGNGTDYTNATLTGANGIGITNASGGVTISSPYTLIYSDTSQTVVSNTASQTSILGNMIGSASINGSTLTSGSVIILRGYGIISEDAVPSNCEFDFTVSNFTLGLIATGLSSSLSNAVYEYELEISPFSLGVDQTMFYKGKLDILDNITGNVKRFTGTGKYAFFTTTGTLTVDVTAQWSTADTDNTVTSRNNTLEIKRNQ